MMSILNRNQRRFLSVAAAMVVVHLLGTPTLVLSQEPQARLQATAALQSMQAASTPGQLEVLVTTALNRNPRLRRAYQEARAAWAVLPQARSLPDPTVGTNTFVSPIETAAGAQNLNLSYSQMLPWLSRLKAREQQAAYEALAIDQRWRAERLAVIAEVESAYYRLYLLGQQIRINRTNETLLESLVEVANARVASGVASQADVLLATVELSRLEEELIVLQRQVIAITAEMNRLLNRPSDVSVPIAESISVRLPDTSLEVIRAFSIEQQPEIVAARLGLQATTWGIEVARLQRRPDITLGATWYAIGDNRPPTSVVDVGRDAVSIGASATVPLWHSKYDAMRTEASREHLAAHAELDDIVSRYETYIAQRLAEARAAARTANLYESSILPQARQTLTADQEAYSQPQPRMDFDRVISDFRALLQFEIGYHRAMTELGIALAQLRQATGGAIPEVSRSEIEQMEQIPSPMAH